MNTATNLPQDDIDSTKELQQETPTVKMGRGDLLFQVLEQLRLIDPEFPERLEAQVREQGYI